MLSTRDELSPAGMSERADHRSKIKLVVIAIIAILAAILFPVT